MNDDSQPWQFPEHPEIKIEEETRFVATLAKQEEVRAVSLDSRFKSTIGFYSVWNICSLSQRFGEVDVARNSIV